LRLEDKNSDDKREDSTTSWSRLLCDLGCSPVPPVAVPFWVVPLSLSKLSFSCNILPGFVIFVLNVSIRRRSPPPSVNWYYIFVISMIMKIRSHVGRLEKKMRRSNVCCHVLSVDK
jgi:hypothetical protein